MGGLALVGTRNGFSLLGGNGRSDSLQVDGHLLERSLTCPLTGAEVRSVVMVFGG